MRARDKKKVGKIANYILNNITMAEILTVLAQKSTEIAKKIVTNKLDVEDYKQIILSDKNEFKREVEIQKDKKEGWLSKLAKKLGLKKDPLPVPKKPASKDKRTSSFTGKKKVKRSSRK